MPSKNDQIGVAIFGAGNVSSGHLDAYLHDPRCKVVAIGSRTKAGAEAKAREVGIDPATIGIYDDIGDLLNDKNLDALSITTPHTLHSQYVVAAANAGKHCLVEKPIAMNEAELDAMDAAVTKAGTRTVCGFVLRFNPATLATKAIIDEGLLGTVYYVQTDYWHNPEQSGYPDSERHLQDADTSAMMLGGCHAVDLARYIMGSDIVEVSALSYAGVDEYPHPTGQTAIVRFANGKAGKISASVEQWMPYQFNVDVMGTDGGLRDDRFYSRRIPGITGWIRMPTVLPDSGAVAHHPFAGEIGHFLDCVIEDKESHVSVHDAVNTHRTLFAIDRSCAEGGTTITV